MRKSLDLVIANTMTFTLLLSALASVAIISLTAPLVYAQTTTIYIDPPSIIFDPDENGTVGTLFNVTAWVSDVVDLCAYQVQIRYDESLINVTRSFEPIADPNYVMYNVTSRPYPDNMTLVVIGYSTGRYTVAGMPYPSIPLIQAHFNGTGLIFIFEFNITRVPLEGESPLSTLLNITHSQTFLSNGNGQVIPVPTLENGFYEILPEFSTLVMMLTLMTITATSLFIRKKLTRK